jgi:hypothetical protein
VSKVKQVIPPEERLFLRELSKLDRMSRVRQLYQAGWTLAAIGNAFNPPKQRSTIYSWVTAPPRTNTLPPPPSPSSSLSTFSAAEKSRLAPTREYRRTPTPSAISAKDLSEIQYLSPLAQRYRARANPTGIYAESNIKLTELCERLYSEGITVTELAKAAGVTYRAMARRLGR